MIREFWVENYLSIKDRQEINFESSTKEDNLIAYEIKPGHWINKLGVICGSNASGKTNMLYAMSNVFKILYGTRRFTYENVRTAPPFAMNGKEPTKMFVSFYADGIRYDYTVVYTSHHIISEDLFYYPHDSKALFYQRQYIADDARVDVKLGQSLRIKAKDAETLLSNTLNNHSVLSTLQKASFSKDMAPMRNLLEWIRGHVHDVIEGNKPMSFVDELKDTMQNKRKYAFFLQMLKKADFNLSGFRLVKRNTNLPASVRAHIKSDASIPDTIKSAMLKEQIDDIDFSNTYSKGQFDLPLDVQSNGTLKYLKDLNFLYELISEDHIYFLDELDEDLHYDLLVYYLNVFLFNSDASQLVMSTQEISLLNEDLLNDNRDIVWFVEKDKESAASSYKRADKFGLHKNLSLYRSYMVGKLGAKPEFGSPYVELNDYEHE